MKPFRERNPLPIGVIFLAALAALLVLAFNIKRLPFASGTSYAAAFPRADGLRSGDDVMVGGVVVGNVTGVSIEGTHVRVSFRLSNGKVHVGDATTASVEIATLLGNKYLSLAPKGTGRWPADRELPLDRTQSAYDVEPAFQGLTRTVGAIDTTQLATALDTLAATFKDSPASVKSMLSGLSRLSQTIASRDTELSQLLQHSRTLTAVLAARRADFTKIFGNGDQLLVMLEQRRAVIDDLLTNTTALARQLTGLVHDNQATIGPALTHLHDVLSLLNSHQSDLDQIVKGLYVFVRGEVDATGSGPWFDGTAINATNPFHLGTSAATVTPVTPRTLGDLLGVPSAQQTLATGTHR